MSLSLLPLMVAGLLATYGLIWFLNAKNDLLFVCEKGVLQSQAILVKAENSLIALNKPIQILVAQKKFLKKALLVAKTPVEISLINARLVTIEIQLALVQKQQTLLHTTANMKATRALQSTAQRMKQHLNHATHLWNAHLLAMGFAGPALIQLQSTKIDPSAHIYQAATGFTSQQTLKATASLTGRSIFPRWLQFLHTKSFSWQESCFSRPFLQENNQWTSELGTGKF